MLTRYHIDILSSSTRRVYSLSSLQAVDSDYGCNPECGDVVIAEISELGQHTRFEEPGGKEIPLQVGNVVAVVLGRRYSTREFYGEIPGKLTRGAQFDLLNIGGIAGEVLSRNVLARIPTRLIYLGHAIDDRGQKMNTAHFGIDAAGGEPKPERFPLTIIAVFGADMDCGKTLTAGRMINILSAHGFKVGGGKLTGTSRMKDILWMKDRGAHLVLDFMDIGYPSTYRCSLAELEHIFKVFEGYFSQSGCEFLVMEVADGIFQRETEMVFHCPAIMKDISLLAFAAGDSVSAYGGICYLQQSCGLVPDFVSGLVTANSLSRAELDSKLEVRFLDDTQESRTGFMSIINQKFTKQRKSYGDTPGSTIYS
ncbi:MAG: hypothetical protein AB1611_20315 [bacterium]